MQIKFFKKEDRFEKEKESLWLNINLYWELMVFFIIGVILASSLFGYSIFKKISKESFSSAVVTDSQVETVSKQRIEKVLNYFSLRKQKSSQILNSPLPIIDPSL